MPQNYQGLIASSSRLLEAVAIKNDQHRGQIIHAVSFSKALKGGAANV